MTSLRIACIVHHDLEHGAGAAGSTLAMAERLRRMGHDVHTVGLELVGGGNSLWTQIRFPFAAARWVRRVLRENRYDVIEASTGDLYLLTAREIRRTKTVIVTRSHGLEPLAVAARRRARDRGELHLRRRFALYHGAWRLIEVRRSLCLSDLVLVINESEREYVQSILGVSDEKIILTAPIVGAAYNGGVERSTLTGGLLVLGGSQWRKGFDDHVTLVARLLDEYPSVAITWLGVESVLELGSLAEHSQRDRIKCLPSFLPEEAADFYSLHRVVLMRSRFEGLPMSLVEAMSHGLLVVTTDVPGPRDLVSEGRGFMNSLDDLSGAWTSLCTALFSPEMQAMSWEAQRSSRRYAPDRVLHLLGANFLEATKAKTKPTR